MTPDEHTIQETYIDVGDGHTLYVQEWGSPGATVPVIFLHGGPGGSSNDQYKTSLNPSRQRAIFFDQRGCGKSLPCGSREHNTTADLVEDIEKIAAHLRLASFILHGTSWGSCLALAYALRYPKRVHAMVLSGIFTGSQTEIDWINQGGFRDFFPEQWEAYLAQTPKSHRHDPSTYHYKHALGTDAPAAKASAYAYKNLEASVVGLDDRFTPKPFEEFDPGGAQIEMYYLANRCFMPDRFILKNAHKLAMPVWIVQGRYDFVCPPRTAYELHQTLPDCHLIWTTSGHRGERETWNVMRTILAQLTA